MAGRLSSQVANFVSPFVICPGRSQNSPKITVLFPLVQTSELQNK